MLKHMLSGTAIALLIAAAPAYAQTDTEEEPTAQEQGQTEMDAQGTETPGDEGTGTAQDDTMGTDQDTDAAQDDTMGADEDTDAAQDDTMGADDGTDAAQDETMGTDEGTDAAQDDTMGTDSESDAAATDEDGGIEDGDMAASDAEPTETFIQTQDESEVLASELMGASVENSEEESLGSINDVLVDEQVGVKAVVIGVGGFLGIGEKNVAVNYDEIEQVRDADSGEVTLVFSATSEELENAPEFTTYEQQMAETEQGAPDAGMGGDDAGGMGGGTQAPAPAQ